MVTDLYATVHPNGIAVDATYFYTNIAGGVIMRAFKTTGAGFTALSNSMSFNVYGLVVDASNVYWTNHDTGDVYQCPVTGVGGGNPVHTAFGQSAPFGVAVGSGYVYWTGSGSGYGVRRGLIGSMQAYAEIAIGNSFGGVALDVAGAANPSVYWGSNNGVGIARTVLATGVTTQLAATPGQVWGIAADATTVYWTDTATGVWKVPIAGGSVVHLATVPASAGPTRGLAVDATSVYYAVLGTGVGDGTIMKVGK